MGRQVQRSAAGRLGGAGTPAVTPAQELLSRCLGLPSLCLRKVSSFPSTSSFLNNIRRRHKEGRDGRRKEKALPCGYLPSGCLSLSGVGASAGVCLTAADLPVLEESESPCECPLRAKASLRSCSGLRAGSVGAKVEPGLVRMPESDGVTLREGSCSFFSSFAPTRLSPHNPKGFDVPAPVAMKSFIG